MRMRSFLPEKTNCFLKYLITHGVLKHIPGLWMQRPIASFTRFIRTPWNLQKAIIKTQTVSYRILPSLLILSVIWKQIHDPLIDFGQCHHFIGILLNCHRNQ